MTMSGIVEQVLKTTDIVGGGLFDFDMMLSIIGGIIYSECEEVFL